MKLLIGKSKIDYDQQGKVLEAEFTPNKMVVTPNTETFKIIEELAGIEITTDADRVAKQAELLMSSWFAKIDRIELADREKVKIISELDQCHKYPDGQFSTITMLFYMVDIPSPVKS